MLSVSCVIAGCASREINADQVPLPPPDYCALARPIYIGEEDTLSDETARQILAHNLLGERLCKW